LRAIFNIIRAFLQIDSAIVDKSGPRRARIRKRVLDTGYFLSSQTGKAGKNNTSSKTSFHMFRCEKKQPIFFFNKNTCNFKML